MSNDKACFVAIALILAIFLGYAIVSGVNYREEAIANNCAEYNPISGKFEWRERE